jgi:predicted helicase
LFHYCYALFFAPTYRERYADLLRSDFPRVFLAHDVALVRALCRHGEELVLRHLLRFPDAVTAYAGPTSPTGPKNMIESGYPKHDGDRVLLNPQVVFEHVPSEVWEYHVGGHQVCKKWWHDRRGRQWTAEEATCYRRIVASVQATLQVSHVIEETIIAHGGWPRAFQTG